MLLKRAPGTSVRGWRIGFTGNGEAVESESVTLAYVSTRKIDWAVDRRSRKW
ncbi:MAG: hypothetical protein ACUVUU_09385 [bacterium]